MKLPARVAKVAAFSAVIALSAATGARCDPAADFFAGKQVSLFIGTTAGGGYDLYARVLARHMGHHIPGHPSLVLKNMPGAGGLALANYLFNRAPNDGTEFGTVQNGLPFEKLFQTLSSDGKNALFDATKFGWIGSITQTVFVTVTWHAAAVKTLEDATVKEVVLGASAMSSDSYILAMLSNNLLGTKFKVVHGYAGATDVDLAVENGEVQGEAGKDWTTLTSTRPQWIRDKKINILVQMGTQCTSRSQGRTHGDRTCQDRRRSANYGARVRKIRNVTAIPGAARRVSRPTRDVACCLRCDDDRSRIPGGG